MSRSSRLAHRLAARIAAAPFRLTTSEFEAALTGNWRAKQKALAWMRRGGGNTVPGEDSPRVYRVSQQPLTKELEAAFATNDEFHLGEMVWLAVVRKNRGEYGIISQDPQGVFHQKEWLWERTTLTLDHVRPFLPEIAEMIWATRGTRRSTNVGLRNLNVGGFIDAGGMRVMLGVPEAKMGDLNYDELLFIESARPLSYRVMHSPADVEYAIQSWFPMSWDGDPPKDAAEFMKYLYR